MADKTVIISVDGKELTFRRVTGAKISEELDTEVVKTFDEPVSNPSSDGGFKVDIDALEARTVDEFFTLKQILQRLKKYPGDLTIKEIVKVKGEEPFEDANYLGSVLLTNNEVSYDASSLTARSLSFNAETLTETVNGDTVEWD